MSFNQFLLRDGNYDWTKTSRRCSSTINNPKTFQSNLTFYQTSENLKLAKKSQSIFPLQSENFGKITRAKSDEDLAQTLVSRMAKFKEKGKDFPIFIPKSKKKNELPKDHHPSFVEPTKTTPEILNKAKSKKELINPKDTQNISANLPRPIKKEPISGEGIKLGDIIRKNQNASFNHIYKHYPKIENSIQEIIPKIENIQQNTFIHNSPKLVQSRLEVDNPCYFVHPVDYYYYMGTFLNMKENPEVKSNQTSGTLLTEENYKTELCKNWKAKGDCSYGNKCRFAHGEHELINKCFYNPKYKSKKCESFHNKGSCIYGTRCNFIHYDTDPHLYRNTFYSTFSKCPMSSQIYKIQKIINYVIKLKQQRFQSWEKPTIDHYCLKSAWLDFWSYVKEEGLSLKRLPVFKHILHKHSAIETINNILNPEKASFQKKIKNKDDEGKQVIPENIENLLKICFELYILCGKNNQNETEIILTQMKKTLLIILKLQNCETVQGSLECKKIFRSLEIKLSNSELSSRIKEYQQKTDDVESIDFLNLKIDDLKGELELLFENKNNSVPIPKNQENSFISNAFHFNNDIFIGL